MWFPNLEKAIDSMPRKIIEHATMKKEIPQILVRAVMGLYERTKKRVS